MNSRLSASLLALACALPAVACGGRDLAPPSNAPPPVAGGPTTPGSEWRIDAARSRVAVDVASSGLIGHDHHFVPARWGGTLRFDPKEPSAVGADLAFGADCLHDQQPAISEETRRDDIDPTVRGPDVLEAARYPEVRFVAQRLVPTKSDAKTLSGTLVGTLILHGRQKEVSVPLTAELSEQDLHATGEARLLQTDFGISPMRKILGIVAVADAIKISFDLVATPVAPPPSGS